MLNNLKKASEHDHKIPDQPITVTRVQKDKQNYAISVFIPHQDDCKTIKTQSNT